MNTTHECQNLGSCVICHACQRYKTACRCDLTVPVEQPTRACDLMRGGRVCYGSEALDLLLALISDPCASCGELTERATDIKLFLAKAGRL